MKSRTLILILAGMALMAGGLLLYLPDPEPIDGGGGSAEIEEVAREAPSDPWRVDDPVADREKHHAPLGADARADLEAAIAGGPKSAIRKLKEARHYDLEEVERLLALATARDTPYEVRTFAIELAGHNLDDAVGERLLTFLREEPDIDELSFWQLIESLSDRSMHGRTPAREDIVEGLQSVMFDDRLPPDHWRHLVNGFTRQGAEAPVEDLSRVLVAGDDPERRRAAGEALLHADPERVRLDDFRQAIRSDETGMLGERFAVHAVEMGHPKAGELLLDLIRDDDAPAFARAAAARLAGTFEDLDSLEPLIEILEEGSAPDEVQAAAGTALAQAKPEGLVQRLGRFLRGSSSATTRRAVATALAGTGSRTAANEIRDVLRGRVEADPTVRAAYVRAMAELGSRSDRELLRELAENDASESVREAAEEGLHRLEELLLSDPER